MKKTLIGIFVLLLVIAGLLLYLRSSEHSEYKKRGEELIEMIEEYRNKNGHLPEKIDDLGVKEEMNEGPYYEKKDSLNYIVYFNIGFDNSLIYHSSSASWKEVP